MTCLAEEIMDDIKMKYIPFNYTLLNILYSIIVSIIFFIGISFPGYIRNFILIFVFVQSLDYIVYKYIVKKKYYEEYNKYIHRTEVKE